MESGKFTHTTKGKFTSGGDFKEPWDRQEIDMWRYVEMILWMLQVLRHHSSTPYLFAISAPITNDQCYGPVAHALRHRALHCSEIINLISVCSADEMHTLTFVTNISLHALSALWKGKVGMKTSRLWVIQLPDSMGTYCHNVPQQGTKSY